MILPLAQIPTKLEIFYPTILVGEAYLNILGVNIRHHKQCGDIIVRDILRLVELIDERGYI